MSRENLRSPFLARLRLRALTAASPLIVAELTFNLQHPLFQKTGLHTEAQLTWFDSCPWSHVDPKQALATSICPMECHVRERPRCGMASHA